MSSDSTGSDDGDGDDVYVGTRVSSGQMRSNAMQAQQNAALAQIASGGRLDLNSNPMVNNGRFDTGTSGDDGYWWGMFENGPQPTVWDAVNYPHEEQFKFESFYIRYIRQPEAKAVVDKPVNDTWQEDPIIKDEKYADEESPQSEFEKKVKELMSGEHTRRKPTERLKTLDKLARLGHYAVMVFGFGDGRPMETPVGGVSSNLTMDADDLIEYESRHGVDVPDDLGEPEFDSLDDLMYLAVFGEDRVTDMETNHDMSSPRFRLPEHFDLITEEIEPGDESSSYNAETVHWTRVLHAPEGTLEDDLNGIPALKPIFHELLNIDKIRAASGEGYWRAGYQGLHVRPPQDSQGKFMEFENDGEDVHAEIQDFLKNFDRTLATPAQIDSIESSVSDPMPHLDANYEAISAATDIPKSILTGKDRADTADATDLTKYERTIASRRNSHATPNIVKPFFQRLIDVGILPEPEGDGFVVEWPPLEELSDLQEWELKNQVASAIKTIAPGGDTSMLGTVPELRAAIGWNPNMGGNLDDDELDEPQEDQMPDRAPLGQAASGELGGDPDTSENESNTVDTNNNDDAMDETVATNIVEHELAMDESELPTSSLDEFPYPHELYERPVDAESRAKQLGLEPTYRVHIIDGDVRYVPGENVEALASALERSETAVVESNA